MRRLRGRGSKLVGTLAIAAALVALGWLVFGRAGVAASLLLSFPTAAWRHDNEVGAFFPLAMLPVIVILLLTLLMAMLGMLWAASQ